MKKQIILVDLDGTLAIKDWKETYDPSHIGDPIPLMLARVKQWIAEGKDVKIFTARLDPQHNTDELKKARLAISEWTKRWVGKELPASAIKDYRAYQIWDDRAIQVEHNTGIRVDGGS